MPTFTSPFTGDIVQPTDVSYYALNFDIDTHLSWPAYTAPVDQSFVGSVPAARIMDCNPDSAGLTIFLPPGAQGAVGTDILIRNISASDFVVTDSEGDNSVTVAAGAARYFYLTDNSTDAGTWANFTYGAGTSAADAASLAGNGLATSLGKLVVSFPVFEITATPTLTDTSRANSYIWSGGLDTFTLPNANDISANWFILVRNNGFGALTLQGQVLSTVDGQQNVVLNIGDSCFVLFDKSVGNFYTVGRARPLSFTFSSATYDVDTIVGNTLSLVTTTPIIQRYIALAGTRTQTLTVELPASTQVYYIVNDTGSSAYDIEVNIQGSSNPPLTFSTGTTSAVLCDGSTLYILTQTSTGTFFANDGTASAPSYTFTSDISTGMFLVGVNVLGFAANGVEILRLDGTNPSDLQISTDAQFNAALIAGGGF